MESFYLTLNQGITNFKDLYGTNKYQYAEKVANYFKDQIDETSFSKYPIDLFSEPNTLGYGYEKTNILQKYYPSNGFNDEAIVNDLKELIEIYESIIAYMETRSYDEVIEKVIFDETPNTISAEEAIEKIKDVVDPDNDLPYGFNRKLVEIQPKQKRTEKFKRLTTTPKSKIDYVKKAYKDAKTGLLGEELALDYEKKRLNNLGLEEYAEKVVWVSKNSDSLGYDIDSYDIDKSGNVFNIKIEVKTTSSRIDNEFFVSKNELEKSKEYKNRYCVFRIIDSLSQNPQFYRVFGPIEDHFILDPYTYTARYKF